MKLHGALTPHSLANSSAEHPDNAGPKTIQSPYSTCGLMNSIPGQKTTVCMSPMPGSQFQSGIGLSNQRNSPMFHYVQSSNMNLVHHDRLQVCLLDRAHLVAATRIQQQKIQIDSNVVNQKELLENLSRYL